MLSPGSMATVTEHVAVLLAASVTVYVFELIAVGVPTTNKAMPGSGVSVYGGVPPVGTATGPGIMADFASPSAANSNLFGLHVMASAVI